MPFKRNCRFRIATVIITLCLLSSCASKKDTDFTEYKDFEYSESTTEQTQSFEERLRAETGLCFFDEVCRDLENSYTITKQTECIGNTYLLPAFFYDLSISNEKLYYTSHSTYGDDIAYKISITQEQCEELQKKEARAILFRVDAIEPITMSFYPEKEYYFEDIEIPRETSDEYQEREYMEVVNEDTISAYIDYTTSSCMVYGTCLGVYHE